METIEFFLCGNNKGFSIKCLMQETKPRVFFGGFQILNSTFLSRMGLPPTNLGLMMVVIITLSCKTPASISCEGVWQEATSLHSWKVASFKIGNSSVKEAGSLQIQCLCGEQSTLSMRLFTITVKQSECRPMTLTSPLMSKSE